MSALGGLVLFFLSLLLFVPLSSAQIPDLCGQGDMQAILLTVPPCFDSTCGGTHYGDVTIFLTDCTTGDTLGTIQQAFHHVPPCSLGTPCPGDSFPLGGVDTLQGTMGQIFFSLTTPPLTETLFVLGDMQIMRSDPDPTFRTIDTEIISMDLRGFSPSLGPISVTAGTDFGLPPSLGDIVPMAGTDYPAFSSFNINFMISDTTTVGIEERGKKLLRERPFFLHQAFPNPLTTLATIRFGLKTPGRVSLNVYNLRGERVKTLIDDHLNAGLHKGIWDLKDQEGKEVSSGVYFYRLTAHGGSETRKIILIR
jgi:hypothetical protein